MAPEDSDKTKELEARIAALELGATFKATQTEVQKVQASCLQQLREVKTALEKDSDGGSSNAASTAQTQAVTAERDALQRKVAKLEYRIQHLIESMEYLYEKTKTQTTA